MPNLSNTARTTMAQNGSTQCLDVMLPVGLCNIGCLSDCFGYYIMDVKNKFYTLEKRSQNIHFSKIRNTTQNTAIQLFFPCFCNNGVELPILVGDGQKHTKSAQQCHISKYFVSNCTQDYVHIHHLTLQQAHDITQ